MVSSQRGHPINVTFAMTHPVQYYSPWFRFIEEHCPQIDLSVVYATVPTSEQQGVGFGVVFEWDTSPLDGYDYKVVRPAQSGDYLHSDRFFGLDAARIGQAVLETNPDVVVVPGWYSVALVRVLMTCRLHHVPSLYRGDTQPPITHAGFDEALWRVKNKTMLKFFDAYLTVGQRNRAYLRSFGIGEQKIFFAPHCVDNELFAHVDGESRRALRAELGISHDEFVVLFVGKLDENKRADDVIAATARLGSGVTTIIVGAGPRGDDYRALAQRVGANVVFAGFVNQREMGRFYSAADLCVLPSIAETWGLVVNEALAAGTPCVVSDGVGCGPDLIKPGVTGEVFPAGNVDALVDAIDHVRAAKQGGHDFLPACRDLISNYSFENATDGLLAGCEYLLR